MASYGYPIPTSLPLPPRETRPEWPGWTGLRKGEDHTTHRAANGATTNREEGDTPC